MFSEKLEGDTGDVVRRFYRKEIFKARAIGFGCGLIVMALMNIGDVHVCMGECDNAGYALTDLVGVTP